MSPYCLVTGASSGIGRAIAIHMSKKGFGVLAVARRQEMLAETQALGAPGMINVLKADITTEEGRNLVAAAVKELCPNNLQFVVQNAGILGPVGNILTLDPEAWRQTFALNVDAPLFLTQKLIGDCVQDARILHISSGAAHKSYDGWGAYCTTKAAFHMLYKCLKSELGPRRVHVGSLRPGIVESGMQEEVRTKTVEQFSAVEQFKAFKDNEYKGEDKPHKPPAGGLDCASNVAHFVDFLLTEVDAEEFSREEWDLRDEVHHHRWISS